MIPTRHAAGYVSLLSAFPTKLKLRFFKSDPQQLGGGGSPAAAGAAVDQKGGTRAQPGHRQGAILEGLRNGGRNATGDADDFMVIGCDRGEQLTEMGRYG